MDEDETICCNRDGGRWEFWAERNVWIHSAGCVEQAEEIALALYQGMGGTPESWIQETNSVRRQYLGNAFRVRCAAAEMERHPSEDTNEDEDG